MNDYTRQSLESGRPLVGTLEAVRFCLQQLYRDKHRKINDEVCHNLTYEELIGALLLARDDAEEIERGEAQ